MIHNDRRFLVAGLVLSVAAHTLLLFGLRHADIGGTLSGGSGANEGVTLELRMVATALADGARPATASHSEARPRRNTPTPKPEPEPEPEPASQPKPKPAPAPEPEPTPVPEPKPAPVPEPEPTPVPEPKPAPAPEPEPTPVPEPKPAPEPEPEPTSVPEPEPTPVPEPEPEPTPEPDPEPAPEPEPTPELVRQPKRMSDLADPSPGPPERPQAALAPDSETGGTTAPPGGRQTGAAARGDYLKLLFTTLQQHKEYPRRAQLRREQGVVRLAFTLTADGSVRQPTVVQSSGSRSLDRAALRMLDEASPLPAPPARLVDQEIVVPVQYRLR